MTEDMMKASILYGIMIIQIVTFLILLIYYICQKDIGNVIGSLIALIPVVGLLFTVVGIVLIYDYIISRNTAFQMIKRLDEKINQLI